jgi:AraC family transcriptional activator of tynA and feaB
VGDAALADSTLPGTYFAKDGSAQWFSLQLPRRSLMSHLGFAPSGGLLGPGNTVAGRLLFQLVRDARRGEPTLSPSQSYMRLAIYDLIGALFAPSDPAPIPNHTNKLFKRTCDIIMDRFTDPSFGPCEVAAEAGISLRYLQKLFTAQNSTCSHFIQSVRLDHASRLLRRQKSLATNQPLSEIAYASGFSDYTNFARGFRRRFGHTPGAHCRNDE